MNVFDQLKNRKILLVDDDEIIRDSMSLFFEGEGCNLLTLETAEEAMKALKQQSYDIIISDYKLPGINGIEFFKRIKSISPHSLKILITAFGDKNVYSMAEKIGINELIEKPFTTFTIEASLSRLINKLPVK